MNIFISAGEPSGDLHGSNLTKALLAQDPQSQLFGFGGDKMQQAGCKLIYPLADLAIMGLYKVLTSIPRLKKILQLAIDHFIQTKPDVLVLIDYPGFHWHLAAAAKKLGIPVIYYVPPQIWAWASWRVRKMRRLVDLVLCNFPFEEKWFSDNNVPAKLISHPYYDQILNQKLDETFVEEQREKSGVVIALLPGSRNQEVALNLNALVKGAKMIHQQHPQTRFLVAAFSETHKTIINNALRNQTIPIEVFVGKTPEIISLAYVCAAVSGSVSLELLAAKIPTAIIFQTSPFMSLVAHTLKAVPYITLVNLLAGKELFPERFGCTCPSKWISEQLGVWLKYPQKRNDLVQELSTLKNSILFGGASEKGAKEIIQFIETKKAQAAIAA